jgi:hypothetical protein
VSATQVAAAGAIGLALYAGHHVGDYWVQTDHQARHKGDAGHSGARACLAHVISYLLTQALCLAALSLATGLKLPLLGETAALAISGVTHYAADRREHGVMFRLARLLLGKAAFLELGKPRGLKTDAMSLLHDDEEMIVALDNPTLGTGAWALDQAWHIFWGVFVAALLMAGLS